MGFLDSLRLGICRRDETHLADSPPSGNGNDSCSTPPSMPAAEGRTHEDCHAEPGPGNDLRRIFSALDADGDGKISSAELASALHASCGATPECSAEDAMQAVDLNGDGSMDFNEFKTLMLDEKNGDEDSILRQAFAVYDQDGDGLITAEELSNVLAAVAGTDKGGEASTLAECQRMIQAVDLDGDGAVSFKEFAAMMEAASARGK